MDSVLIMTVGITTGSISARVGSRLGASLDARSRANEGCAASQSTGGCKWVPWLQGGLLSLSCCVCGPRSLLQLRKQFRSQVASSSEEETAHQARVREQELRRAQIEAKRRMHDRQRVRTCCVCGCGCGCCMCHLLCSCRSLLLQRVVVGKDSSEFFEEDNKYVLATV